MSLLLAGGAAAMGFLAKTMYDDYKDFQANEELMKQRNVYSRDNRSAPQPSTSNGGKVQINKDEKDGIEKKDEDISEPTRCIVCMDNVRNIVIDPCGHVCLCANCAKKIVASSRKPKCPVCQGTILNIKSCYLS